MHRLQVGAGAARAQGRGLADSNDTPLLVLGIESSCDDTACAVLDGSGSVLSSVVSSQLAAHRPYGGVVPEIACRAHLEALPGVIDTALEEAGMGWPDIGSLLRRCSMVECIKEGRIKGFLGNQDGKNLEFINEK